MTPLLVSSLVAASLSLQQTDLGQRLVARGAAPEFARQVVRVVGQARSAGLPVEPLTDKAFEGLAKGYSAERILPVVQQLADRLRTGRSVAVSAGVARPPSGVVAAVAEALGRGMERSSIIELLRAAPVASARSVGLTVAASLVAQGIAPHDAARAVEAAYHDGRSARELLELPSVTSNWLAEGMTLPEVVRRIQGGQALPFPPRQGAAPGSPQGIGTDHGPPITPPSQTVRKTRRP